MTLYLLNKRFSAAQRALGLMLTIVKKVKTMSHSVRSVRAEKVFEGLLVGDAVGDSLRYQYYHCRELSDFSSLRPGTLRFTDDAEIAVGLVEWMWRSSRDAFGEGSFGNGAAMRFIV